MDDVRSLSDVFAIKDAIYCYCFALENCFAFGSSYTAMCDACKVFRFSRKATAPPFDESRMTHAWTHIITVGISCFNYNKIIFKN